MQIIKSTWMAQYADAENFTIFQLSRSSLRHCFPMLPGFSKMYPILHVMNVSIQWENELSSSTGILVTPLILDRCYPAMTHSKCLVTAEQNAAYAALMPQTSSIQVCGEGSKTQGNLNEAKLNDLFGDLNLWQHLQNHPMVVT